MIKTETEIEFDFGLSPSGRAFSYNLFAKKQKGFPLQSLTQIKKYYFVKL